jgi:hypothetical protein
MSDLTHPDKLEMSCPLLEKLALETRAIIYEYVLSFETLVKHATNLKPFLEKLTGGNTDLKISTKHATNSRSFLEKFTKGKSDPELENAKAEDESAGAEDEGAEAEDESAEAENESVWESVEGEDDSDLQSAGAEPESSPSTEATGESVPLRLVNTSILTANKLIYTEAIAVFYKINIISTDAQFLVYEALESPRTTDLSLATQIATKTDLTKMAQNSKEGEFGPIEFNAIRVTIVAIPAIFPNLRSSKFFMCMEIKFLFHLAATMCAMPIFSETRFDGVGSVTACSSRSRNTKFVVQCKETMESWAAPTDDVPPNTLHPLLVTAGSLYRALRGNPQSIHAQYARNLFSATSPASVPQGYGPIDYDSYEFWTVVDQALSTYQHALGAQAS